MQYFNSNCDWNSALDASLIDNHPKLKRVLKTLGRTQMIKMISATNPKVTIYAKAEFQNPWGTIKDRSAFALIYDVLGRNRLEGKESILEYSGGSLGVALANLCSSLGLPLTLVLFDSLNEQQKKFYKDKKVKLVLVPPNKGFLAVIRKAHELNKTGKYCFLNQHENRINPWWHQVSTGSEIVHFLKSEGRIDNLYFGASVGTGGTFQGISRSLLKAGYNPKLFLTCPAELPYGSDEPPNGLPKFAGSGGLGFGIKQKFIEDVESEIHEHHNISFEEAQAQAQECFEKHGLSIGTSAGANLLAAERIASRLEHGSIVTVFPSLMPRQ